MKLVDEGQGGDNPVGGVRVPRQDPDAPRAEPDLVDAAAYVEESLVGHPLPVSLPRDRPALEVGADDEAGSLLMHDRRLVSGGGSDDALGRLDHEDVI
jgi:hypothetical protein